MVGYIYLQAVSYRKGFNFRYPVSILQDEGTHDDPSMREQMRTGNPRFAAECLW